MKKIILISIISIILSAIVTLTTSYFSFNNKEIALRTKAEAQYDKIEGVHDKMWKVLQQKAQVSNEYKKSFFRNLSTNY